jgi:pyrroloquinoline quinone biosynthesis protein D
MSEVDQELTPRLAPGVRLKFDTARDCWVVLAPERVLMPDETALEILRRCDGQARVSAIIDDLAKIYDADRQLIAGDVAALIDELTEKGIIRR